MKTVIRSLLATFTLCALLLALVGGWLFTEQKKQMREEAERQLNSISRLKVDQIVQWRRERLGDAAVIADNPFLAEVVGQWLQDPDAEPAGSERIRQWFVSLSDHYQYSDVYLVDAAGSIRLALSGRGGALEPETREAIRAAVATRKAVLSDLHRLGEDSPHQDGVAPILVHEGGHLRIAGCIVLRADAGRFLYPMLQTWPVNSTSAETLLIRRDGDGALFLNELRHRHHTALALRIPVSRLDVPAIMVIEGRTGLVEGLDYREEPVLAVVSPVPDSPWFMVAKVDLAEAMAPWRTRARSIIGLLTAVAFTLAAGLGLVGQRSMRRFYQRSLKDEIERRRAEARYRTILMSVGDGVIVCDSQGQVTLLNPVAESLTGWSGAEAAGRPLEEVFVIVNETSGQTVENPVTRVLREGVVVGLANHTSLIARDGSQRPIADSGAPIFDEDGGVSGAVLVFRDQSEERRAEAELTRSNHLLVRAEEMAVMGCWEFDFNTRTVWASPSACRIYGLDDSHWTIEQVQAIPLPEHRAELNRALRGLIQSGEPYDVEFRIRRPSDGALVDIRSQAEYNRDEEKVFGVIQDISEVKRTQAAIIESESRYRSLFQNNHAVMLLIDPEQGEVVDANPAAIAFYGWSREELLGKKIPDIEIESEVRLQAAMAEASEGASSRFEFRHRLADGQFRDVEVFSGLIKVGGRERLYSIVHDISQRKAAEEQQQRLQEQLLQAQKLESVGRLAGGVAHDLNNMLSPILGYADMLLSEIEAADPRGEYVRIILQAGNRARDLIRQLLAFGRRQTLYMETVDLNEVIAGFVPLLRRTVREEVIIELLTGNDLPVVRIDSGQIEQVLMNLVVNAQDAMPEGGRISLETDVVDLDEGYAESRPAITPGRYVRLTVSDTGSGMEPEVREQIFSPFFTTKEKGKGTGLGLAMVYGIVKQHGGNIWVYSEPGDGTTFKIYLPASDDQPAAAPRQAEKPPEEQPGSETVLVVEDNDMVRQMTADILSRRGYTVLTAEGGRECLDLLAARQGPVDLLITDVIMPEMNGKALYKKAVQRLPGLRVLYMSGYTENVIASRGVLESGVHFIQKPFTPRSLAAKVREVLAG